MTPGATLRLVLREGRGAAGRLAFLVVSLALGVAAVTAVAALGTWTDAAIRGEARELLAADLSVDARRPLPPELDEVLRSVPGAVRSDVRTTLSMVSLPSTGRSRLAALKAPAPGWPFYGTLVLEPARPLRELLGDDAALLDPELLRSLGARVGDEVKVGAATFRIAGVILEEPDRGGFGFGMAPRLLLTPAGLDRADLLGFGSRATHRALVKLPPGADADEVAERIRERLPAIYEVETWAEAQPALREGLQRSGRFLGLVALLSLLVGGIGVAQTVRSWVGSRWDALAVQKCLGMTGGELLAAGVGQVLLLALLGSALGAGAGIAAAAAVRWILADLLPATGPMAMPWGAAARGTLLGLGVALAFSLPPLLAVRRVPPLRVLRRDVEPARAGRVEGALAGLLLLGGIALVASAQAGSWMQGGLFALGLLAAAGALSLAALLAIRAVRGARRLPGPAWARHGLAGLARPGAGTVGAVTGLGLGVLVLVALAIVRGGIVERLRAELPDDAPTTFLVDVQVRQWDGLRALLEREGATRIEMNPFVTARLAAVDGVPVEDLVERATEREWVLTREQRITWLPALPPGNELVAGALFADASLPEVSVEEEFARDLGATVGSVLRFDVQGVPVDLHVTSLRTVEWRTFGVNFFLVAEPGVLDAAPQSRVAAVRLPEGKAGTIQDAVAAAYPNVVVIDIRQILRKVADVAGRIGLGVNILGTFTAVSGLAILAGAIAAAAVRRRREAALLKVLGMTRRDIVLSFGVEAAGTGLAAGLVGTAAGGVLAWAVLRYGMDLPWEAPWAVALVAVAGTALLSMAAGTLASLPALRARPAETLRRD